MTSLPGDRWTHLANGKYLTTTHQTSSDADRDARRRAVRDPGTHYEAFVVFGHWRITRYEPFPN